MTRARYIASYRIINGISFGYISEAIVKTATGVISLFHRYNFDAVCIACYGDGHVDINKDETVFISAKTSAKYKKARRLAYEEMQARALSGNGSASGVNKSVITGKGIQAELTPLSKPRAAEEKEAKDALAQVEALVQAKFSAEDSVMGEQADAPAPPLAEVKGEGEAKERKLARHATSVVSDDKLPVVSDQPATCCFCYNFV